MFTRYTFYLVCSLDTRTSVTSVLLPAATKLLEDCSPTAVSVATVDTPITYKRGSPNTNSVQLDVDTTVLSLFNVTDNTNKH